GLIGLILLIELFFVIAAGITDPEVVALASAPIPPLSDLTNTEALGQLLYTRYVYLFQAAGMVLLVAMIGAIVLTLRQREGVRKQSIARQVARTREESIEIKTVTPGSGI
ncbi:MAG: NADH-quinone oxidoreductase subunit J, partial [Proteobacteria bacterium]|nr:NADH-quinone oxidoreductase subunit J [Pseudomonadota bacterium]